MEVRYIVYGDVSGWRDLIVAVRVDLKMWLGRYLRLQHMKNGGNSMKPQKSTIVWIVVASCANSKLQHTTLYLIELA